MKIAALRQANLETTVRDAASDRIVDRTAERSLACSAPEQQLWSVGTTFTATCEAIGQWGRYVRARNKSCTLSDQRDIRRIRAEVEAERCKAFWWA
jgi:hypothetical protein